MREREWERVCVCERETERESETERASVNVMPRILPHCGIEGQRDTGAER